MAGPSPADDGLARAVRRVRLAAGSLAGPLDVWTVAVAAAQAVPDVLDPALERLTPSPFAGLAGLVGDAGKPQGGSAAGGAARPRPAPAVPRPAPVAAPPGPAARASEAMAVLGRFVTDELTVLGVTGPPTASPAAKSPLGDVLEQALGSLAGSPAAPAAGGAPVRAHAPPTRINPDEVLLEELELLMAGGFIPAPAHARASAGADVVARRAGVPKPLLPAVRGAASAIGAGVELLEELTGTAPAPAHAHQPAAGGSAPSGIAGIVGDLVGAVTGATAAPSGTAPGAAPAKRQKTQAPVPTTLAEERRKLLDALTAATAAAAASAAPAAATSAADRDDVAWLVNEALVEQARLHGVDLR